MQGDADGDGIGDACDPCTNVGGQSYATSAKVLLARLGDPAGDDRFKFKGQVVLPFPYSPPLDPSTNGVRIVVLGASGSTILDATIPGGAFNGTSQDGWTIGRDGKAFIYRHVGDVTPKIAGIKRVVIVDRSSRDPGRLKFVVQGKDGTYGPIPPADIPVSAILVFDVPVATTGQCAEAVFPGPLPAPNCQLSIDATFLVCR